VDYSRLIKYIDRFEIYMAVEHQRVSKRSLLGNVRRITRRGRNLAGSKPFQFHTWFADLVTFRPMERRTLEAMIACAADEGAAAVEIYTYKIHDWRVSPADAKGELPAFRAVSMKYNPNILRSVAHAIRRLK
jgi:hypothetical protein